MGVFNVASQIGMSAVSLNPSAILNSGMQAGLFAKTEPELKLESLRLVVPYTSLKNKQKQESQINE